MIVDNVRTNYSKRELILLTTRLDEDRRLNLKVPSLLFFGYT